jgi:hypothetical protein
MNGRIWDGRSYDLMNPAFYESCSDQEEYPAAYCEICCRTLVGQRGGVTLYS